MLPIRADIHFDPRPIVIDKMRGLTGREAKEVHVIAVIANYINASKTKDRSIDLPLYATKYEKFTPTHARTHTSFCVRSLTISC
jgi:hypothetical protein